MQVTPNKGLNYFFFACHYLHGWYSGRVEECEGKDPGSSPDIFFYFSGECLILICIKCILNDTNFNNSFKIHHFKKKKKHFHHCTRGDLNRLPQQLEP